MVRRFSSLQTRCGRRRYRIIPHGYQLTAIFLILFSAIIANGQTAIGLYEGMMGNSGAAASVSSAPSFYNPSLLGRRQKDSYSLSANSFGTFNSKSEGQQGSSLSLNPNYLGSVIVGTSLVHELFFTSTIPAQTNFIVNTQTTESKTVAELQADANLITFGYSMAFRSIPFALSYFAEFSKFKSFGFTEFTSFNSPIRSTLNSKTDHTSLGLGISLSGNYSEGNYTLGYNFKSRRLNIFRKDEGSASLYTYGSPGPNDYTKTEITNVSGGGASSGSTIIIGHSFKNGDHEFLTDSLIYEEFDLTYRFKVIQTFGYRMTSESGHQFMCGINHLINPEIKYFGQSAYYSAGYSWLTRSLRSAIGVYYYSSRLGQEISALGLTFGSEFSY